MARCWKGWVTSDDSVVPSIWRPTVFWPPRAFDSGEETDEAPKGRHLGHLGRRTLKWTWIEAAHVAVRHSFSG